MKNILLLLLIFIGFSPFVFAQDQIHLLDKTIVAAKVITITKQTITYKKQSNLNGPTYNLSPLEVWYIQYENGSIDSFTAIDAKPIAEAKSFKQYNNIIALHPFTLVGNISNEVQYYYAGLTFERLMAKGNIGIKGIFRTGLEAGLFSGGLQAKWYPTGQGVAKYYLGLGSEIFAFQNDGYYGSSENLTSIYFVNGVSVNVTNRFNISAEASIGDWFTGSTDQELFYIVGIGFGVRF
jgi:hypothetical protein